MDSTAPPAELLLLTEGPAFLTRVRLAAVRAFDRYEPAAQRPDYASQFASAFAKVFGDGLRSDTTEERTRFLDDFVRQGLAAGASGPMLLRRFTFLVTCVVAELGGSISAQARHECILWLGGFVSGFLCDLLPALERQSSKGNLLR